MGYIIGTDEAGYGPNLGPLVIAATVWQVPGDPREVDLYHLLREAVTDDTAADAVDGRIVVADSKRVYRPGLGLGGLEYGVLAALAAWHALPANWDGIWQALAPDASEALSFQPWFRHYACTLPLSIDRQTLAQRCDRLQQTLAAREICLLRQRAKAVFPQEFNHRLSAGCNKSDVLSQLTLSLVGDLLGELNGAQVLIVCDKHGGRNHYQEVLQRQFADSLVLCRGESQACSTYVWSSYGQRLEAHFRVGAEAFLPVAWASMTAKYLRELAMQAFNAWWLREVPGLAPTAGYPTDAARFRRDIDRRRQELEIDDTLLWRVR